MQLIPNNSLRNPIVEQIVRETLFVVKDAWEKFGQPDEIHIELARELKKNIEDYRDFLIKISNNNPEKIKLYESRISSGIINFFLNIDAPLKS